MTDADSGGGGDVEVVTKIDYFRDTPIRLLGYANEVGEAFRQLVKPRIVHLSYIVASTYCLADATSKAVDMRDIEYVEGMKNPNWMAAEAFIEAAVWQGLASVVIPGFTINRICWLSGMVLRRTVTRFVSAEKQKMLVTAIGMGSIPFIIKPIDYMVDRIMEETATVVQPLGLPGVSDISSDISDEF